MNKAMMVILLIFMGMLAVRGEIPPAERVALEALYHSTNGDSWWQRDGWLGPAGTECAWYGIVCNAACTHVTEIQLNQNNLTGELPPTVGAFSQLEILAINFNPDLSGILPSEIGNLTNLKELLASGDNLQGDLPPSVGNLTDLIKINLSRNDFSGTLPPEWGNLVNLEELILTNNNIEGSIPTEIGNLTNLKDLELIENLFSGSIPTEIGQLTNLQWLGLGLNPLSGSIPTEIGNLTNLEVLGIWANILTGPIPTEIGNLTHLWFLNLCCNQLTGAIPSEIGNLVELQMLALDTNQLSGPIPPEIGNMRSLGMLRLWNNQITGPIPSEMGNLKEMRQIWMQNNLLDGSIPSELGSLSKLDFMVLSDNELSGSIPTEFGNMKELGQLFLTRNQLSGSIPTELGNLPDLGVLHLDENQLTGEIPTELGDLTMLRILSLYHNQLTGPIPTELGGLSNLTELILTDNHLTGSIPTELSNLTNLQNLSLSHNELNGPIPANLGTLTNLFGLDLGHNQLTGAIPTEIGLLTTLLGLDLNHNALSGPVPAELGNLSQAFAVQLAGNRLSGPLPESLRNLTNLDRAYPDYGGLDLRWNALYTDQPDLLAFLADYHATGSFGPTQTVAPGNVTWADDELRWDPIPYTADGGGYMVWASPLANGPYQLQVVTGDKLASAWAVSAPPAGETRFWALSTVTAPHENNQSSVVSEFSEVVRLGPAVDQQNILGAHVAVNDAWWTRIRVVNTGVADHPVVVGAVNPQGELTASVVYESLPPWQALDLDLAELFPAKALAEDLWLTVASKSTLAGVAEFGTRDGQTLVSIPLVTAGGQELVFPYVIVNKDFFTGLTLVNTADRTATARLEAFTEDGQNIQTVYQVIPPYGKYVRLVEEVFSVADPGNIRFVEVESDRSLTGFEIFGSYQQQGMAGIPALYPPALAGKDEPAQTCSLVYPYVPDNEEYLTGVTVSNLGEAAADVQCMLYDTAGNPLAEALWDVTPGAQVTREIWNLFQGEVFPQAAWLNITAAAPVIGFELVLTRSSSDPFRFDGFSGVAPTATDLVLPWVKNGAEWMAVVMVTHPAAGECAFTVTAYDESGLVVDTVAGTLPGYGQQELDLAAVFPGEAVAAVRIEAASPVIAHIVHLSADLSRMSGYAALAVEAAE